MKTNETTTASRIYFTTKTCNLWHAEFQPINPKTGKPWQASRYITRGRDAYELWNYETKATTGAVVCGSGKIPKDYFSQRGDMNGGRTGFSTEQKALDAIAKEKETSGK